MVARRIVLLICCIALLATPLVSSAVALPAEPTGGYASGNWCYGTTGQECFANWGPDKNNIVIWGYLIGAFDLGRREAFIGEGGFETTGTKVAPHKYRLDRFTFGAVPDVSFSILHRTILGYSLSAACSGYATVGSLVSLDLLCAARIQGGPVKQLSLRIRGLDTTEPVGHVSGIVFDALGLDTACNPRCPRDFEGAYF